MHHVTQDRTAVFVLCHMDISASSNLFMARG